MIGDRRHQRRETVANDDELAVQRIDVVAGDVLADVVDVRERLREQIAYSTVRTSTTPRPLNEPLKICKH
jgi:hypothetical protein